MICLNYCKTQDKFAEDNFFFNFLFLHEKQVGI